MVDGNGWHEEEDYVAYPKEKWCDMDYMAAYIKEEGYKPVTTMENLVLMIIAHFEDETDDDNSEFLPRLDKDWMINIERVRAFVEASGGIKEFDYVG